MHQKRQSVDRRPGRRGKTILSSDIPAILSYTRKTYIMNDGEIAIVMKDKVWVTDLEGNPISKKVFEVNWDAEAAEKGGFEHFMLKEIYEQPKLSRIRWAAAL